MLLPLLTVSVRAQPVPQGKASSPTALAEAMVTRFYKEVVARHPIAEMGDPEIFRPYFSTALLRRFDDNTACRSDWDRQNPGTTDKPPFSQLEMGLYSGSNEESSPDSFHIERAESGKDGSFRVQVKLALTYRDLPSKFTWNVAVVVVRENGRPVVNDVIYLKDKDHPEEYRLSEVLGDGCRGPRWVGQ